MKRIVHFSVLSVIAMTMVFLTLACEDDLRTDPVANPLNPATDPTLFTTDSTGTEDPLDDFPPICYTDSVWMRQVLHYTICCVPLDEDWFYCYSRYDEGFAFDRGLFKNGFRYKYHYCDDGSDSLLLANQGFDGTDIHYLLSHPHICLMEYEVEGKTASHKLNKVAFTVSQPDYCDMLLVLYEDFSTTVAEHDHMKMMPFSHIQL